MTTNTHTLGLRGHFSIRSLLQKAADQYGVRITSKGSDSYHVDTQDRLNLSAFTPSFIHNDASTLSRHDTKSLLDFMNQPLRVLAEKQQREMFPDAKKNAHSKASYQDRVAMHRLLRFATTGSVEIPVDAEEELEKETAECHAKTEQAMRDMDAWRNGMELGSPQESQSAVPHSTIDPQKGFKLELHERCHSQDPRQGIHQEQLNTLFWDALNTATDSRYEQRQTSVYLSASELERFYTETHKSNFYDLIDKVEFEEAVQEKLESVASRVQALEFSSAFKRLSSDVVQDRSVHLHKMMQSSTALQPIIGSKAMSDIWARYNFTERHASPLGSLAKEYSVFAAVMTLYTHKPEVTPQEMEAITQEFSSLISFSEKMADTLKSGFEKADIDSPAKQMLEQVKNNFSEASLTNISVSADMLKGDYQDVLSALEKSLSLGGSAIGQTAAAGADTAIDFTMDVVNFIKESPKVAATFVALATTLYMMNNGGSASEAQSAAETIMVFGQNGGLEQITIDAATLPEEAQQVQNWHWDMGPLGMYKHYMYDNAVVGPAQTMMDWMRIAIQSGLEAADLPVNANPAFSQTAQTTADALGKQLFNINLFQNASHAAFWMYMVSKGYNHGFKGANKIFDLMSPLTDLTYQAGMRSAEMLHLKKRNTLSQQLASLTDAVQNPQAPQYRAAFQKDCTFTNRACALRGYGQNGSTHQIISGLTAAAQVRLDLEDTLPKAIKNTKLEMKIGGTKEHFQINAENLHPTLKALDQFDLVLEHMADQIGIDEPWYQHYVRERLDNVTKALHDFRNDGDANALQTTLNDNLQQLVETQIQHTDTSPVYTALFGQEPSDRQAKALSGNSRAQYGTLKRAQSISENRKKLSDKDAPLSLSEHITTRASIYGTALWGGIVGVSRKIRQAAGKTIGNKGVMVATSGLAAACVAIDMAGGGNGITNAISSATGGTLSSVVTTTTFALYNFWEDVLGVHVGSGLALLAAGAGTGYACKRIIAPTFSAGFEGVKDYTGLDIADAWNSIYSKTKKATDSIANSLHNINVRTGKRLTVDPDHEELHHSDEPDYIEEEDEELVDALFMYDSDQDDINEDHPSQS